MPNISLNSVPRIVSFVSLIALVGLLIFTFVMPKSNPKGVASRQRQKEVATLAETNEARDRKLEIENFVALKTWQGDSQTVTPAAFAIVNRLVTANKLKLVRFQPQKTGVVGELAQLPFVLTVEGSYLQTLKLTEALEAESKLVVTLVQLGSSDPATDATTATIGLTAYLKQEPEPATQPATGGANVKA